MEKKLKEATHCTRCGKKLVETLVPARDLRVQGSDWDNYYEYPVEYNTRGQRQMLRQVRCPMYKEGGFLGFGADTCHDTELREVKGFEYVRERYWTGTY